MVERITSAINLVTEDGNCKITSAINLVTEDGNCESHPPLTWLRRMVIIKITSAIKLVTEDGNYDEFYQPNDPFGVRVTILTQS